MITFYQSELDSIKLYMAEKQGILPEDITDAMVFEYLKDATEYEEFRSVYQTKDNPEGFEYDEPRHIRQIAQDMKDHITERYLARI